MGCGGSKEGDATSPSKTQQSGRGAKVKPEQVVVQVNGHSSPAKSQRGSPTKGKGSTQTSVSGSPQKSISSSRKSTGQNSQNESQTSAKPAGTKGAPRATKGVGGGGGNAGGDGDAGDQSSRSRRSQAYSRQESHGDVVRSEPNDKGYKRRLREKLRVATAGKDMEALEHAIDVFQKSHLEDCGDLSDALNRLEFLKLKRALRDAVRRRHVGVLDKAIEDAENSPYAARLQPQIDAAERMRTHLRELNKYKHDILQMEQSTISEIHSYQRPPACVHDVMAATYMMLGYHESRLTDWADIQGMLGRLGRDKLLKQVEDFDTTNVEPQTVQRVKEILDYHQLDEIRAASNGAARFYVWCSSMVDKCERDSKDTEEKRDQEEEGARQKKG